MKRIMTLLACLVIVFCLIACGNKSDVNNYYGTYSFEELSYLTPLSSSKEDYFKEQIAGTQYTINDDLFKFENAHSGMEIASPKYVREEISADENVLTDEGTGGMSDVRSILGEEIMYRYNIYDKDGSNTNWILYVSSDSLWVAFSFDNTEHDSKYISYIIKTSKIE